MEEHGGGFGCHDCFDASGEDPSTAAWLWSGCQLLKENLLGLAMVSQGRLTNANAPQRMLGKQSKITP